MTITSETLVAFTDHAETEYEKLSLSQDHEVIMYYCGDLNFGFANALVSRLEKMLDERISDRRTRKRFFTVFIEAIQNIRIHGCADTDGKVHATVLVYRHDGYLCAYYMNIVSSAQAKLLTRRYSEVNALSREALREKYLDVLQTGEISDKGGAGLGIITIVMRSKNPAEFEVMPLSDNYRIFSSIIKVSLE